MLAYTYIEHGKFQLLEKPRPKIKDTRDAIVRVTLGSICTSDLHIKHGSVLRAVPGVTVGHEMVGVVEEVGSGVVSVRPGDRVTVNVETFAGTDMLIIVLIPMGDGHWDAVLTVGRRNISGFHMPIKV